MKALQNQKVEILDKGKSGKTFVSLGRIRNGKRITCVDTEHLTECREGEIGEIWIKGPEVGIGYFNREEENKESFGAVLSDTKESGFLRTGDLGFIWNQELYIVGRKKEVMVIHGKKFYQVDVEETIKNHIPELTLPLCVFSNEIEDEERVIVVVESDQESNDEQMARRICECISMWYGIAVYDVAFVNRGTIPTTPSGKLMRKKCSLLYSQNKLPLKQNKVATRTIESICAQLKEKVLSAVFKNNTVSMEKVERIAELGFDSIKYIQVAKKIKEQFHVECNPTVLFQHQRVEELAEYILTNLPEEMISQEEKIEDQETGNQTMEKPL